MNGIELYHLQNTGKFFGFSREKEARIFIIIIIFFRIENMNGIELYHLQNTGKIFRVFSREESPVVLVIHTNGTENFWSFR